MHFSSVILIKVQKSNNIYNCAIHNSYFDFKWTHINHRLSTIEWWSSKAITIKRAPITSNQSFPIRTHYRSYNDVTKITLNFRSIASNWLLKKRHTKINLHISIEKWNWRKTIFSKKKEIIFVFSNLISHHLPPYFPLIVTQIINCNQQQINFSFPMTPITFYISNITCVYITEWTPPVHT